jgi:hypothetical protein
MVSIDIKYSTYKINCCICDSLELLLNPNQNWVYRHVHRNVHRYIIDIYTQTSNRPSDTPGRLHD